MMKLSHSFSSVLGRSQSLAFFKNTLITTTFVRIVHGVFGIKNTIPNKYLNEWLTLSTLLKLQLSALNETRALKATKTKSQLWQLSSTLVTTCPLALAVQGSVIKTLLGRLSILEVAKQEP